MDEFAKSYRAAAKSIDAFSEHELTERPRMQGTVKERFFRVADGLGFKVKSSGDYHRVNCEAWCADKLFDAFLHFGSFEYGEILFDEDYDDDYRIFIAMSHSHSPK